MTNEMDLVVNNKIAGRISFQGKKSPDRLLNYNLTDATAFYSDFYSQDQNPLAKTREIQFAKLFEIINPHLKNLPAKNTLDVGCGSGGFVSFLEKNLSSEFHSFGVEPALTQETPQLKKLLLNEIPQNDVIPRKYGLISLLDVFEHFTQPQECLDQLENLLESQGLLLIKVPNKNSAFYRLAKSLRRVMPQLSGALLGRLFQIKYPPPHFFYYDLAALEEALASRFKILHRSFMSECPISGLWTRFWGIPKVLRPLAFCLGLVYRFFSFGSLNDSVVVLAAKR
jgi:SAM-dependent methyltransferase